MATKKGGYFLKGTVHLEWAGKRVPSVTTILNNAQNPGGLIHWAWQTGMDGKDYREERDVAAEIGTMAHKMAEEHARFGANFDEDIVAKQFGVDSEKAAKAMVAFKAFLDWKRNSRLEITDQELHLTSEQYGYGGTFDALLVNGRRAMGDWKTSSGIYPQHLAQVRAYGQLWEENFPDQPIDGGYHIIRFDRETGGFTHHYWPNFEVDGRDLALEKFHHSLAIYEDDKVLKKMAK